MSLFSLIHLGSLALSVVASATLPAQETCRVSGCRSQDQYEEEISLLQSGFSPVAAVGLNPEDDLHELAKALLKRHGPAPLSDSDCYDTSPYCDSYHSEGYCWYDEISQYCRRTCMLCTPDEEEHTVVPAAEATALVATAGIFPISVTDCGGSEYVGSISGYTPKSVATGQTTVIKARGAASEDISGGTLNIKVKMTGFPWSTLGEWSSNICDPLSLELRALGIYGGKLEFDGFKCPVKAGELEVDIRLTLSGIIPARLANVRADVNGTGLDGKPLLCATVRASGR